MAASPRVLRGCTLPLVAPHPAFFEGRLSLTDLAATDQNDRALVRRAYDLLHDDPAAVPADLPALLVAIEALANTSGSALCVLHPRDHDGELHVEIEHGRPPVTDDVVGETLDLTQMTVVRTERARDRSPRPLSRAEKEVLPSGAPLFS